MFAKSFSVVEGKYNLPDLVANCLKSSKNDHKFLVSSQVILSNPVCSVLFIEQKNMLLGNAVRIVATLTSHFLKKLFHKANFALYQDYGLGVELFSVHSLPLGYTSGHRPGSAGNTSITPDYVHVGGRVH
ncbi:hypothetical protein Tco_1383006 [Tanacetum coccineum]